MNFVQLNNTQTIISVCVSLCVLTPEVVSYQLKRSFGIGWHRDQVDTQ